MKAYLIAMQKSYRDPFVNVYWNAESKRWVDRYDATVYHAGTNSYPVFDPSKQPLDFPVKWDLIYV